MCPTASRVNRGTSGLRSHPAIGNEPSSARFSNSVVRCVVKRARWIATSARSRRAASTIAGVGRPLPVPLPPIRERPRRGGSGGGRPPAFDAPRASFRARGAGQDGGARTRFRDAVTNPPKFFRIYPYLTHFRRRAELPEPSRNEWHRCLLDLCTGHPIRDAAVSPCSREATRRQRIHGRATAEALPGL